MPVSALCVSMLYIISFVIHNEKNIVQVYISEIQVCRSYHNENNREPKYLIPSNMLEIASAPCDMIYEYRHLRQSGSDYLRLQYRGALNIYNT